MTLLLAIALVVLVLAIAACVVWRRARRVASRPVVSEEYVVRESHHY